MSHSTLSAFFLILLLQTAGVIGNPESKLYHRPELAHVKLIENPISFSSREEAEQAGYHPCPVCYYPHPPQIRAIQEELLLAAQIDAQVRLHYPKWENTEALTVIHEALDRVLDRWPVPLKGYRYRVGLMDTDILNAIAVPAGQIYVTRGLWQTIESEGELEAILALQVAHIEGRHALRSWETSQGVGALGRILGGVAAASTGLDLSRVINYAKKVVLSGYSQGYAERAESLMVASLVSESQQAGARRIFQKLFDLYRELGRTRSPFANIPVSDVTLARLRSIQVYPVDLIFTATIPRTTGLTAKFTLSRITCDGAGCHIFGLLEVLRTRQSTQNEPALFLIEPQSGGRSQMELLLENSSGSSMNWSMNIHEKQLSVSTVIGNRGESGDLPDFLREEIRTITLIFQFTTNRGGNPIGNRLVLTPVSGSNPYEGGR